MINSTRPEVDYLGKDEPLVAKFVGYSTFIQTEPDALVRIHFEKRWFVFEAPNGMALTSSSYDSVRSFMKLLPRLVAPLDSFARDEGRPKFPKHFRAEHNENGSIEAHDGRRRWLMLSPNIEPRAFLDRLHRNMGAVLPYIEDCFKLSRRLEGPHYEKFVGDIGRNGYATTHFHGVALLSRGRIDYRPVMRTAKYHDDGRLEVLDEEPRLASSQLQ
jgi:hypothetical protein